MSRQPAGETERTTYELVSMLCREAGDILRENFSIIPSEKWKRGTTRFPELELRLLYLAAAFVKKHFPEHQLLGDGDGSPESTYLWICDPIDGVYFYTHGVSLYTFSIALLKEGDPIVAAVYDPTADRLYYAEKGKGAMVDGKPVAPFFSASVNDRLVVLSGGHGESMDLGGLHNELRQAGAKAIISYSTIQMAMLVAMGGMGAVIYGGTDPQDGAAVKLIIEESGGIVTSLHGNDQRYDREIDGFIATTQGLHQQLLAMVSRHLVGSS